MNVKNKKITFPNLLVFLKLLNEDEFNNIRDVNRRTVMTVSNLYGIKKNCLAHNFLTEQKEGNEKTLSLTLTDKGKEIVEAFEIIMNNLDIINEDFYWKEDNNV